MINFIKFLILSNLIGVGKVHSQNEYLPIVFIHGMIASGDTYANFHHYLSEDGYPTELIKVLDWNTLNQSNSLQLLSDFVDEVLERTFSDKVILVGHSAGGRLAYKYMDNENQAAKVAKYIHIGSFKMNTLPGGQSKIPTLNIYSSADRIAKGGIIEGATNVMIQDMDHYEVATSRESYEHIKKFLEIKPVSRDKSEKDLVWYSGRVLSLGENKPVAGVEISIKPVVQKSQNPSECITIIADESGYWPKVALMHNNWYEFTVSDSVRTIMYHHKAAYDNPLFYLRTLPPGESIAGMLLLGLPSNSETSTLAIFLKDKAAIYGRDKIIVNGIDLSSEALLNPQNSTIALFMYDDGDRESSGSLHARFAVFPFLKGVDVHLPATERGFHRICLNDECVNIPSIPSDEAIQIVVW